MKKLTGIVLLPVAFLLHGCVTVNDSEKAHSAKHQPHNPKAAALNAQLGLAYLERNDTQRAKRKLLRALQQDPGSSVANGAMAFYLERTGNNAQANDYYQRAIKVGGSDGEALNNYGTFLCRQHDFEAAQHYFMKAVANPDYVDTAGAYENAAMCAQGAKHYRQAAVFYEKAIAHGPGRTKSMYQLVKVYDHLGEAHKALNLLQTYEKIAHPSADLALIGYKSAKTLKNAKIAQHFAVLLQTKFADSKQYEEYRKLKTV